MIREGNHLEAIEFGVAQAARPQHAPSQLELALGCASLQFRVYVCVV